MEKSNIMSNIENLVFFEEKKTNYYAGLARIYAINAMGSVSE